MSTIPPLPTEVKNDMPKLMQEAIDTLNKLSNIPEAMAIPGVLAVANFAAQGLANVDYMAFSPGPINEYFMVLNESGSMKSTMFNNLKHGIDMFEKQEEVRYNNQKQSYARDKSAFDQILRRVKADEDLPDVPIKPRGSHYTVDTFTLNGLIDTLGTVPFVGMFNADAANFFNSHAFQDKKSGKDVEMTTTLSKLFSGEKVARLTGVSETNVTLRDRRFSLFLLLQRNLAGFLNNEAYIEQGITNRFLITQSEMFTPPNAAFNKAGRDKIADLRSKLDPFHDRIYKMLCSVDDIMLEQRVLLRSKGVDTYHLNELELKLPILKFNDIDGTCKLMEDFCNEFGANRQAGPAANFHARCYEHACRLAATLTLFEDPRATEIPLRYARCGIGLVRWFITQRESITIDVDVSKTITVQVAEDLNKWLIMHGVEITKRDLQRMGPASYRKLDAAGRLKVIEELVSRDIIEVETTGGAGTKKKPSTVVRLI